MDFDFFKRVTTEIRDAGVEELGVFYLGKYFMNPKLSKLGSVGGLHTAKAGAPLIEGRLAKATGPAKFLDGHACVSLFEEANDLLIGKSGLFHSRYSLKLADFVPSLWYGREGAGQILVPVSACLSAKAICSSVNLLFFTACPLFQEVKYHAGFLYF